MAARNAEANSSDSEAPLLVVGVGASAGGLEAFQEFVGALSDAQDLAIVFLQHHGQNSCSLLPDLLRRQTSHAIEEIVTHSRLNAGCILVCPPGGLPELQGNRVIVTNPDDRIRETNPIDHFFHSLAEERGERSVGVILSGTGSDGTLGLKAISDAGGMTFAQDAETAKFDAMPRHAATTGVADHVMPPAKIAAELMKYAAYLKAASQAPERDQRDKQIRNAIPRIAEILLNETGHDFRHYKVNTLGRRIQRRIQVLKLPRVDDYLQRLERDKDETQNLFRELLIGVTAFFRDPESFRRLSEEVIPRLFENRTPEDPVRIWVPGCATGEEAYTIAILCREYLDTRDDGNAMSIQIFASDIDERALSIARQGIYPSGIADHVSAERLDRFFVQKGTRFHVRGEIRETVLFSSHNLISDPPFSRQDLISCRNLLIYLGPHLQKKLIPLFLFSLRPNGFLFLGPSESISTHGDLFRSVDSRHRISQRKGTAIRRSAPLSLRTAGSGITRPPEALPQDDDKSDVVQIMQRIILDEFSPRSVVIDENGQVICSSADTHKYLSIGEGPYQNNILRMARQGLRIGLRATLSEARARRRRVVHENLSVETDDGKQRVMVTVQPMMRLGEDSGLFLVVFQDVGLPIDRSVNESDDVESGMARASIDRQADQMIELLERELTTTREDLEKTMQEMETANEELKSTNEELLSMNEELQSANEELETSKEEIRAGSEAVLRTNNDLENLLRSTQIATIFLDSDLTIRSFTPAATEIYSLIETDIGRPLERFVPAVREMPPLPDARTLSIDQPVEHHVIGDNGRTYVRRVLPYQSTSRETDGMVVTFVDVSEIVEREAQLASLMSSTAEGIYGIDLDGICTFANAACATILGYNSPNELLGRKMHRLIHHTRPDGTVYPGDACRILQAFRQGERMHVDDEVYWRADGTSFDVEYWSYPQIQDGRTVGCVVTFIDITDRRRSELELADARARLELSLEVADVAPWSWDMQTGDPVTNPTLNRLFGFQEDATPSLSDFLGRIAESAQDRVSAAIRRAISTGETYDEEYPIRWPGGEVRYLRARGRVRRSDEGMAEDFFGVVVDITDRKRREIDLAGREAHLRRVIDSTLFFIGVLDVDGTLVEANATALHAGGIGRDEVIGRKFWECYWWSYDAAVSEKLKRDIETALSGEIVRYDAVVRMANNTRMTIDFMLSPVRDIDGRITHLIPSGVDISDRIKAESTVRQSEQRLKMALKAGGMAAWEWTPEGSIWTDELYDLLGISRDAVACPETFFRHVHPDDLSGIQQAWNQVTAGEALYDHEFRIVHPDGRLRWLVGVGQVVRDDDGNVQRVFGLNCDITDRKELHEQVRTNEQRFREMANAAPAMVWVTGDNHECTFLSQSWCHFTGQTEEAGLGFGWLQAVHPDDREATRVTFLSAARQREAFELDFRLQTAGGDYRWVINSGKPRLNDTGKFFGYVGSVTDAHDRHEAQSALNAAREAAEAANASKSAFLANMSHEIRTPMTAILGYADLVSELVDHPEAVAHLQTIRRNGAFLLEIINDILDLSKIEADRLDIVRERFDPVSLVEDVRGIMDVRATEGGISLDVEYRGNIPSEIDSDPKRLRQILINLVGNAIKFTRAGGVRVVVTYCGRPSVDATTEAEGAVLQFDIIDSGIGISPVQQKRLFQPFSQGDHNVNREFGGTGLGLAISQRLAGMLGGGITVDSEEGKGSTFSVSIAVGRIRNVDMILPDVATQPVANVVPTDGIRLSCHALVVDDRRDIRFLTRRLLTDAGATVTEAEDGELAVVSVKEAMMAGNAPDVIILDMQMPKLDGYATARALRQMNYPGPIIALTADAMQGDMTRCIECGCNDYLSKPIDRNVMLAKVKFYVEDGS
ncbi:MAG: PAS domain S-box protein [Planctomycetaceae bacterium]